MPKRTIAETDVAQKRALIRVDFNVPLDGGTITDDRRIRMALDTIRSVLDRGGSVVLMSHLGRPEGTGHEAKFSLAPVVKRLAELLNLEVAFPSNDCVDDAAAAAVAALAPGQVLLLENLRFHAGEKKGSAAFAGKLAAYGDVYVNDAFGTCHRSDASMVGVPQAMTGKPGVVGLLVEKELKYLSSTLQSPEGPFTVVLGGAKVADKIPAIDHLLPKADNVLIGGAMAYTFCKALGHSVGNSKIESHMIDDAKRIIDHAARLKADMFIPIDHVCSTAFSEDAGDIEVYETNIPDGYMGLDIGPKTASKFALTLKNSKTIVWNGPMGVFEWRPFKIGTKIIAETIAEATDAGATSIVGGGDSAAAVDAFGIADRFSHVSTGGGASLEMLSGKPFPSIEALDDA